MKVTALSYNISWANQKNILAGSEKDFVQMCQDVDIKCFDNSLKIIKDIENLHLVGLQEVNTKNLENKIIKNSSHLNSYSRGTVGLSSVSLIWNKHTFGTIKNKKVINLSDKEDRPCLIILTTKGYQLISAHFPWISYKKQLDDVFKILLDNSFTTKNIPIILADTNDEHTFINKDSPFNFGRFKLSQGLTKSELKKHLISCCWHIKGHKYQSYDATGDYILAPSSIMIKNYIPDLYRDMLASDHRPVLATLNIK